MGSKRTSAGVPNITFSRTDQTGKEDKCKEFWKYLDEKKTLEPYQPPKFTEESKPCTSSTPDARSTSGATKKGPKYTCNKGAKPKQPTKKETKTKRPVGGKYSQYEKMFREGVKLATWDQTEDELFQEIEEYEKRVSAICPIVCNLCGEVECICSD